MPKIALYARCSTAGQTLDHQLDALRAYATRRGAEAAEFLDHGISGRKGRRPDLDRLVSACRRREVSAVVVVKLDRIARSVRHLVNLAAEFEALGIDLVVLDQGLDTSTPAGRLLFHTLAAVAEFEADLVKERTLAALAAARRRGRRPGPRPTLTGEKLARARRLRRAGRSVREIAQVLGTSKSAVHRALRAA